VSERLKTRRRLILTHFSFAFDVQKTFIALAQRTPSVSNVAKNVQFNKRMQKLWGVGVKELNVR
jgi:hypothetical protein